jgi:hypothetical protein
VDRDTFIEDLSGLRLNFSLYEKCRPVITALAALQTDNEKEAILSVLGRNPNIDSYIHEHLDSEPVFYIVSQKFFDAWCDKTSFSRSHEIKREDRDLCMDNSALIEEGHTSRLKEDAGTVVLPRVVFFPLSKWYKCNKVIERRVITYPSGAKRRKSVAEGPRSIENKYSKLMGDMVYELEVRPRCIYLERISDKGERPHANLVVGQRLDLKAVKKLGKLPFMELQVSKKSKLEDVLR